ncbi:MAG: CDP-alcohol phosphatidyltransferase family protein [Candidatus Aenigmarchaeota archaeon]|nr:CDP-alcohol phosphatidyltransferase family protein [Candidatus Aenigmarchaeota archaeon]
MADWRDIGHKTIDALLAPLENLKLSPNRVSWLSVVISIFVYFSLQKSLLLIGILLLLFVLFLDALDGFLARKKKVESFKGLVVDTSCDRLSEFIIFFPSKLWIMLAIINVYVTLGRLKNKNIFIIPLRHIFLILLVIGFVIGFEKISFLMW